MAVKRSDSTDRDVRVIINQLVADMAALAAKLDADAGVTDTDYAAGLTSGDTLGT